MLQECPNLQSWGNGVPRGLGKMTIAGLLVLVVGVGGFGVWAGTAPIDGAVVASGSFVATSQNKTIQHLEGGIIERIAVNEGDAVSAGDTLAILDNTAAKAKLQRLRLRLRRLQAVSARLEAETELAETIDFGKLAVMSQADETLGKVIARQRAEFRARRQRRVDQESVLDLEISGLKEVVRGNEIQIGALQTQLTLIEQELADKQSLLEKGLTRKPEALALARQQARLRGEIGTLRARIGEVRERIARARQKIVQLRSSTVSAAYEELRGVETQVDDIREQIGAAEDVVTRAKIRAPVAGTIVALMHHTPGGVLEPGGTLLKLLPADDVLIEARVRPTDIDNVAVAQPAYIRLTALNQRTTPMISGEVTYISADAVPRDAGGSAEKASYVVRVKLDKTGAAELPGFDAKPGMPAEVYIKTGERTFFDYLMRPLKDTLTRAFRES
jgi:HlyD family type I secretion membrane fusion protein